MSADLDLALRLADAADTIALASFLIPNTTLRYATSIGGVAGASAGYYMMYWGASLMNPENHAVDRSVADRAANRYNEQLGTTVGVAVGGSL